MSTAPDRECFCGHTRSEHSADGRRCTGADVEACFSCVNGKTRTNPDLCECYPEPCDCPGFEPDNELDSIYWESQND